MLAYLFIARVAAKGRTAGRGGFRCVAIAIVQTVVLGCAQGRIRCGNGPWPLGRLRRRPYYLFCYYRGNLGAAFWAAPEHAGYGRLCVGIYDPA